MNEIPAQGAKNGISCAELERMEWGRAAVPSGAWNGLPVRRPRDFALGKEAVAVAVSLTAALVALFYLGAVPVRLAVCLRVDEGRVQFGVGAAAFEARFARRAAQMRRDGARKMPPILRRLQPVAAIRAGLRAASFIIRRIRLDGFVAEGVFGSSDAALTALVCGGAMALDRSLGAAVRGVRLCIQPDFSSRRLHGELTCIISARAGHIMAAALLGAWDYATGRFSQWTDTPLRAS